MNSPLQIDLRSLPGDGMHLEGTLPAQVFDLAETDPVRAVAPLAYRLDIVRDGTDLVATGSVKSTFSLECGRCLQRFDHRVELADYQLDVPIEKATTIDLTEPVREDILLALPSFPRCEDGNVDPRACPAEGAFESGPAAPLDEPSPPGKGAWDALDQLNR